VRPRGQLLVRYYTIQIFTRCRMRLLPVLLVSIVLVEYAGAQSSIVASRQRGGPPAPCSWGIARACARRCWVFRRCLCEPRAIDERYSVSQFQRDLCRSNPESRPSQTCIGSGDGNGSSGKHLRKMGGCGEQRSGSFRGSRPPHDSRQAMRERPPCSVAKSGLAEVRSRIA